MNKDEFLGYIGTYTKGNSKGIYRFVLDIKAGTIKDIKVVANIGSPTYLSISHDNQYLYSVVRKDQSGGVAAFSFNSETKNLDIINMQISDGPSPCHLSIKQEDIAVVMANYHKGTIESYIINKEQGSINPVTSIVQHSGSGPNKERQEKPHAHYAGFTPDQKYVVAIDLGIDKLITYKESDGKLTEVHSLSVNPGSGPRHLAFHPSGKYAYVMTELSSEVIVLTYDEQNGSFEVIQYISTLPKKYSESNSGSAIHIASDGRFVYAANRGHNSISIFHVNQDSGKLTFVETVSTEGDWPRDFALDPTEKFVVVSNEKSSNLVLFSRNKSTGKLTLLQSDVRVPEPVCVKFLHD
ncbi:lactonase family protein [Bacillus pseudomycoides]|uniref:Lactonase family protein n=1 Tax=Bacillus bingmayongensis TaxID=1150157 RepID=A0ABU5JT90_9BACI|nr:lactonase family protein [Bacillus pseudomycoides]